MLLRRCRKCDVEKDVSEFAKDRSRRDGLFQWCRPCLSQHRKDNRERFRESNKRWRLANYDRDRESNREYQRAWREASRERWFRSARAGNLRRRALAEGLPAETVSLYEIALRDGNQCWMCGDELSEYNPAHLDHLIPISATPEKMEPWGVDNPGTVSTNMALAYPSCNMRKNDRIMLCAVARYLRNGGCY